MALIAQPDAAYAALQHWMARWSEWETHLAALLLSPPAGDDWLVRLDRPLGQAQAMLATDEDATLYGLFQLATASTVGYSSAHAMACWAMCRLLAPLAEVPAVDQGALERAALTMNIGMTRLQDTLAEQETPPTEEQRALIDTHPARGAQSLAVLLV